MGAGGTLAAASDMQPQAPPPPPPPPRLYAGRMSLTAAQRRRRRRRRCSRWCGVGQQAFAADVPSAAGQPATVENTVATPTSKSCRAVFQATQPPPQSEERGAPARADAEA
eukprot:198570-Chlamydomonas_euryale.AAC.2